MQTGKVKTTMRQPMRLHVLGLLPLVLSAVGCGVVSDAVARSRGEPTRSEVEARRVEAEATEERKAEREREQRRAEKAARVEHEKAVAAEAAEAAQRENTARAAREQAARDLEHSCAASRPDRLADVKKEVHDWAVILEKLGPFEDWVLKHCKLHEDTRGIEVSRQRTASGSVVVRTKHVGEEDVMACNAPLPATMTMWKVRKILDAHGEDSAEAAEIYSGRFAAENGLCVQFDAVTGVRLFVRMYDFDGIKKILALKLAAAPPPSDKPAPARVDAIVPPTPGNW